MATPTYSSDVEAVDALAEAYQQLRREIGKVIIGQEEVVKTVLLSLFANGHSLLVGVPGLAKTLLVSTISEVLDLDFKRIQFTPDLMPTDITGSEILNDERHFEFNPGPLFANIVLADEINRTPPKTQAALLEAMQERSVTVSGVRHRLPAPFFVLATQNPIEQEGTYPLPEAQLDRFMFNIPLDYPSYEEELAVVRGTTGVRASVGRAYPQWGGDTLLPAVGAQDPGQRQRTRVRREAHGQDAPQHPSGPVSTSTTTSVGEPGPAPASTSCSGRSATRPSVGSTVRISPTCRPLPSTCSATASCVTTRPKPRASPRKP